jgi:hypothetical protein
VVGHNDMPLVDLIDPPLTTVRVAVEQMGRQAAQMLLELLGAPTQAPVTRMLQPLLSCARPRLVSELVSGPCPLEERAANSTTATAQAHSTIRTQLGANPGERPGECDDACHSCEVPLHARGRNSRTGDRRRQSHPAHKE